jgi:arginyl-tRNA synthetase
MSKRAGSFVTLREVVDEVGKDVVRFMMLTRKNDAPLDFDFAEVMDQSKDNPVFYVQYAHARVYSVLRNAVAEMADLDVSPGALSRADFNLLTHEDEIGLIKLMAGWPRLIETAAEAHEPHRVAFYLYDLASAFHTLWNKGKEDAALRFIVAENRGVTQARLGLIRGVATVIASGLAIMGVQPVEEMR